MIGLGPLLLLLSDLLSFEQGGADGSQLDGVADGNQREGDEAPEPEKTLRGKGRRGILGSREIAEEESGRGAEQARGEELR